MLFNSYLFIFCFLPIVWAVFHILKALSIKKDSTQYMNLAKGFLVLASLFFYAYWKLMYLPILLGSILVNYFLAQGILKSLYVREQISVDFNGGGDKLNFFSHNFAYFGLFSPKIFLTLGIIFNLTLLGVFKYTDFFLENFNLFTQLLHLDFSIPLPHILLPLALSFVTFQQIAFLVDCYKQATSENADSSNTQNLHDSTQYSALREHINFLDYCLFITFFPQLIAGPIVHHKEMMPQFYKMNRRDSVLDNHSSDFVDFRATADLKSSSTLKSTKSPTSNTANLRIFRGEQAAQPLESTFTNADSSPATSSLLSHTKPTLSIINWEYIAKGLFIFSIGLFKKVVIADSFAKWANAGFSVVESGSILNLFESWATSLSYTFQLYFDFSGYCDMAIGLGLLFGIVLPINFNSPYKAFNIATFWRQWHITLGRFLKDYLYIPLGGNQNLAYKQSRFYAALNNLLTLRNIFIVAFLSGVWHGAGWGFVIWGSLHGSAMVVHRIYMLLCKRLDSRNLYTRFMQSKIYLMLCWILTFNFVNIAWVFFRAENLQGAVNLLKGMFFGDLVLPSFLESRLGFLSEYGIQFHWWLEQIQGSFVTPLWILGAFIMCLCFKNSVEWLNRFKPNWLYLVWFWVFFILSINALNNISEFLYFNF